MERDAVLAAIFEVGIIPVIRTRSSETAFRCAEVLHRAGLYAIEIAATNPEVAEAIGRIREKFGEKMVIGAGTVLDADTARKCVAAGAQFLLSPALKLPVIQVAKELSTVVMPGALTPTEIHSAWEAGADAVRIVPCDAMGGPHYLKSLRAPFPKIKFIATGGVTLDNIREYLHAGASAVGVTGALVDGASVRDGHYEIFAERARRFRVAIAQARGL
ncbi:MAG: bifunctional 4-hydroxy-2-oxoglutarate aldolase/2-dehydro-3-deoxy-phosphogluconate aldolase [Acidobacteriota bacterium]|nr:bifunctional 4-hydroxy-2-oxoglutarate aldolase/2-dehydro-3-deoxy-phosphogluconate aldolase [Acidobacteriota bacterium]